MKHCYLTFLAIFQIHYILILLVTLRIIRIIPLSTNAQLEFSNSDIRGEHKVKLGLLVFWVFWARVKQLGYSNSSQIKITRILNRASKKNDFHLKSNTRRGIEFELPVLL